MLLQQILSGLANGFLYALLALGFAAVYRSMRLINFAQGDLFMVGAFIGVLLTHLGVSSFIPLFVLTCVISMLLGMALERCALAPLGREVSEVRGMISTIGISVALQGVVLITWGTEEFRFPPVLRDGSIQWGNVAIPYSLLFIGVAALSLMGGLAFFLKRTRMGLFMRAVAQDRLGAEIIGIDARKVQMIAFGISAAMGGAAGVMIAPLWYAYYTMGTMMGLKGFTAAVLGSLGNFPGAVVGGLLLGVVENLAAGYISSVWKDAVVFTVLLGILVLRPQGLFSGRQEARG